MLLGNHPEHANGVASFLSPHHDRHRGVLLPQPGNDPERDIVFLDDDEIALRECTEQDIRSALAHGSAQPGIDAQNPVNLICLGDHDMPESGASRTGKHVVKWHLLIEHEDISFHDLCRALYKEHVGMKGVGNRVSASYKFECVDAFGRQ